MEESSSLLFGPEVYWGANPKAVIVKYDFDFAQVRLDLHPLRGRSAFGSGCERHVRQQSASRARPRSTRRARVQRLAGSWNSAASCRPTEKVDDVSTRASTVQRRHVSSTRSSFEDTLGFKAKLTFPLFRARLRNLRVGSPRRALSPTAGQHHKVVRRVRSEPSCRTPGLGNKQRVRSRHVIMQLRQSSWSIPRLMYRDNFVDANPFIAPSSRRQAARCVPACRTAQSRQSIRSRC